MLRRERGKVQITAFSVDLDFVMLMRLRFQLAPFVRLIHVLRPITRAGHQQASDQFLMFRSAMPPNPMVVIRPVFSALSQRFLKQCEHAFPGFFGLFLVVHFRVQRAPTVAGGIYFDLCR